MIQVIIAGEVAGTLRQKVQGKFFKLALMMDTPDAIWNSDTDEDIDLELGERTLTFEITERKVQIEVPNHKLKRFGSIADAFPRNAAPDYAKVVQFENIEKDCRVYRASWDAIEVNHHDGEVLFDLDYFEPV